MSLVALSARFVRSSTNGDPDGAWREMNGEAFAKRLRQLGKENGVAVRCDGSPGRGNHGRVYYGAAFTTIKDLKKDIGPDLLNRMLTQLGVEKDDWK